MSQISDSPDKLPGNDQMVSFLRYLVEVRRLPLSDAIERINHDIEGFHRKFSRAKNWSIGLSVTGGLFALGLIFPLTAPVAVVAGFAATVLPGVVGLEAYSRKLALLPEINMLKASHLLEDFIGRIAERLELEAAQSNTGDPFGNQPQARPTHGVTVKTILAAYEATIQAFINGEDHHIQVGDPVLSLFALKLRENCRVTPPWLQQVFAELQKEQQVRHQENTRMQQFAYGQFPPAPMPEPAPLYRPSANTQLRALDVPASSEDEQSLGKPPMMPNEPPRYRLENEIPIDLARSLAENLKSTIVVGQPGSGKGFTVAWAVRYLKQFFPEIEIWMIDPKGATNEAIYWQPCDQVLCYSLNPFSNPAEVERFMKLVNEFIGRFSASTANRKLLILDEAAAIRQKCPKPWVNALITGFNSLCSMGRNRGTDAQGNPKSEHGWLLTQTPNAGDLSDGSAAMRNIFRRVMLVSDDDRGQLTSNSTTFYTGQPEENQFKVTGQVFYDSSTKQWSVLEEYPDLSQSLPLSKSAPSRPPISDSGESRRVQLENLLKLEAPEPDYDQTSSTDASEESEDKKVGQGNVSKPNLSRSELMLSIAELAEWLEVNSGLSFDQIYSKWKGRQHNFSRPEIRYLLTKIQEFD